MSTSIATKTARFNVRESWRVAIVVALLTGGFAVARFALAPRFTSDLDQLWYAGRALARGLDPYAVVGPGREFDWTWPVLYPLPAILLVLPFCFLPIAVARLLFSILAGGLLGFAVGPKWRALWPMFLSEAYYLAISRNQWSPFILASFWIPTLGFFVAAKPNLGLLAVAAQKRNTVRRLIAAAGVLVLLSFVVRPSWFGEWFALARAAPNKEIALLQPGGFLLLGALLCWRTNDARVLLTTAIVPQTPSLYDCLPLFFLCRTTRQALVLAALTHALQWAVITFGPYATFDQYYASLARLSVFFVLIPAMLIALGNNGAFSLAASRQTADPTRGKTNTGLSTVEWLLLFAVGLALSLQLWIVLH